MGGELSHHLGYAPGAEKPEARTNQRNGTTAKTVLTGDGKLRIETPRDRDGSFEPLLIPKHARRFTGFDDSIVALYARGLTVREIQGYLAETYGTEVSRRPDQHGDRRRAGGSDGLAGPAAGAVYPVVFFDALRVKTREDDVVRNKAVYLALGVRRDGAREILGLWIETTEGAKFWMKVFNDLKTRGVNDILIAVTDGLTGMPAALAAVFPRTTLQTCIVHLIRNSLDYASWKDRKPLAAALRPIYAAASAEAALSGAGCVRGGRMGAEVSHGRRRLAAGMGSGDPVLCLPARDPAGDLHHQRDRERERQAAQDHQDARPFPDRRRGEQTDLAGVAQHHRRLGEGRASLEGGDEPVRDPLRRAVHPSSRCRLLQTTPHTKLRTLPVYARSNRSLARGNRPLAHGNRPLALGNRPLALSHRPLALSHRPLARSNRPLAHPAKLLVEPDRPLSLGEQLDETLDSVGLEPGGYDAA